MSIALVTGASRGIGFAMAKRFAEAGYAVYALWHNQKEQLDGIGALDITPVHGDVADAASVAAVRDAVGAVDILVNNAAISRFGLITDLSEAEWDEMMAVNLKSVFLLSRAFLPDMIRRQSGRIINVSSIFGAVGGSCEVAYSAAKAGVIGFTKALAKRGYDVAVNYVSNEAAAQAVVAEIEALGVRSLAVRANTAELPEVKDMFRTVVREMGGLDVLVNNAGVVDDRYLMMLTEDSLTRSLDINIKGYFHCAQQAALKMFKKKSGVIVNISSVSSVLAIPGQSVYSATKGAVNALTATLAKELAPYGIRVNAVAPGFVETEMLDHIPQEQREGYLKSVPMGRFAKPEEVGDAVCTLCDPTLSYLTGQTLILDGGLSL